MNNGNDYNLPRIEVEEVALTITIKLPPNASPALRWRMKREAIERMVLAAERTANPTRDDFGILNIKRNGY